MNAGLARAYYRLALGCARRRDLSAAAGYAREALAADGGAEGAARLLALCLWEMGEPGGAAYSAEAASVLAMQGAALERVGALRGRGKWRAAVRAAQGIEHQSVRVLNVLGCLYAARGRYRRASAAFARALGKDTGNAMARAFLTETAQKRSWW